jgi:two-component system phosphate regulon sensor histidine kinase PhoR
VTTPILSGGEWASLAVFHDLSDVKRVEQVRRDFIANVSHELRTPLAAIKSVIETLEAGAKDDPASAAEFLSRADSEVDRLVQMVEELLELSRLESGDIPLTRLPLDFNLILRNAVDRLSTQAQRADVELTLEVEEGLPQATGDADMLERVVINLVHNAVKFTPRGGSVRVSAAGADGSVRVSVHDTGVGILPEDLPRIFERFYKADRSRGGGGTGLGLAVARHAVEAHGGNISAESTPGEGSTFTFTIPAGTP